MDSARKADGNVYDHQGYNLGTLGLCVGFSPEARLRTVQAMFFGLTRALTFELRLIHSLSGLTERVRREGWRENTLTPQIYAGWQGARAEVVVFDEGGNEIASASIGPLDHFLT